jgi:hypothetical protein
MKILIDIGHPGHVHLFRPFTNLMILANHQVLFTCRDKEFEVELLRSSGFAFKLIGKHYNSKIGKLFGLVFFTLKIYFISLKFRPDIFLSHGSFYAGIASLLLRKPHISLEDSGNMEQVRLYMPFTKAVITPDILEVNLGSKQLRYKGYHELAYLHPRYFKPDNRIFGELGLQEDSDYCLVRLVSWKATHDFKQKGLSSEEIYELVDYLESRMKVFISSEGKPPEGLEKNLIKIAPDRIHNLLYYARIVISEGATISSEAGVMGTPSIYVNTISRCYNDDQEKYGTVINLRNGSELLLNVQTILSDPSYKDITRSRSKKIIEDKIDLTRLLVWFIEGYPETMDKYLYKSEGDINSIIEAV